MPQNARTTLRSVTLLIPFFVIFFVIFFPMGARAEKQDVTLRAADGFTLKGTFYSAEKPGPGLLMLHPCDGNRLLYDHLATMLNTAGYNVLTFDFHGFGASQVEEYTYFTLQRQKIIDHSPLSLHTALRFLTPRNTTSPRPHRTPPGI